MTCLTIVQTFCRRQGLPVPSTVNGTTDPQVRQVMALLEEEGQDLRTRGPWQGLTFEATHTTVATESQGALTTIATNGFSYIRNGTMWDRTDQVPVFGPLNDEEWQARKAMTSTGPRYQFRIRGGLLIVNPVPPASHTWAFEYISNNWILGADGTTYKEAFTLDTDTILLPEALMRAGLMWRWLKKKGLAYAEDFATYEAQVNSALGRDGGKRVLRMDGCDPRGPRPGVFIPQGSWPL